MSKKSIKYSDVFNNPYNDYVCPTFPTCSNVGNDDYYFEFIDKQSVGIVNNKATIQSMDLSGISSYVKSWSQETKVIQPNKTLFIRGEEYTPQRKIVVYAEKGSYPEREDNKSYYLCFTLMFFDDSHVKYIDILSPIYKENYDLGTSVSYINKYLRHTKTPLEMIYDNELPKNSLEIFDTDGDGQVDVWWDGEKHDNGVLKFISTDSNFKYHVIRKPSIRSTEVCDAHTKEQEFIIINGSMVYVDKFYTDDEISEIIDSMDGSDKNNEANIYWSEFDGITPEPNDLIPHQFDIDGDGQVDVWWADFSDEEQDIIDDCIAKTKKSVIIETVKFDKISDTNYFKYPNGAFKGITITFKYPKINNKYSIQEDISEDLKYIHYSLPKETFYDDKGEEKVLYMDGPLFNGNKYIESLKNSQGWDSTSLIYMNVSNDTELIRGMMLYNPHNFPIAATYIKFN